jgi:hypothetical protein
MARSPSCAKHINLKKFNAIAKRAMGGGPFGDLLISDDDDVDPLVHLGQQIRQGSTAFMKGGWPISLKITKATWLAI